MSADAIRQGSAGEQAYLDANPDVKAAVAAGQIASGLSHWLQYGSREGRPWPVARDGAAPLPPSPSVFVAAENFHERNAYLTFGIDRERHGGIEIGALNWPIFKPGEAAIKFVDYAPTSELKRISYASHPENIVEVDYVWTGSGSLAAVVGAESCFDFAIASQVIEHIPNVLGWLRGIHGVLKPGGYLNLAIPDRRFTFDLQRKETTLAQWVEADILSYTTPSPGQVFDHVSQVRKIEAGEPWFNPATAAGYDLMSGPEALGLALDKARLAADRKTYIDTHCSVLTPLSFAELFAQSTALGLIDFWIERLIVTTRANRRHAEHSGYEFFVNLRKLDVSRSELAAQADATLEAVQDLIFTFKTLASA